MNQEPMQHELLISAVQKNTIWSGAMQLTEKQEEGFTREQLANYIVFGIHVVDYWIKRLIDSGDIQVHTSGMLRVDPSYLGHCYAYDSQEMAGWK